MIQRNSSCKTLLKSDRQTHLDFNFPKAGHHFGSRTTPYTTPATCTEISTSTSELAPAPFSSELSTSCLGTSTSRLPWNDWSGEYACVSLLEYRLCSWSCHGQQ